MSNDDETRFNFGLISDVFGALDRHGYQRGDDQAVGAAVGRLFTLVAAYEGRPDDDQDGR